MSSGRSANSIIVNARLVENNYVETSTSESVTLDRYSERGSNVTYIHRVNMATNEGDPDTDQEDAIHDLDVEIDNLPLSLRKTPLIFTT